MRLDYLVHCKDVLNYVIIMCGMESVEITIDITIIYLQQSVKAWDMTQVCNFVMYYCGDTTFS